MCARRLWFGASGRLRIIWRLIVFLLLAVVGVQLAGLVMYPTLLTVGRWLGVRPILFGWVAVVGLLLAHHVALRRLDHLSWSAVGLGRSAARPKLLAWGFGLGGLAIGVPSLALWAVGMFRLEAQPDGPTLLEAVRTLVLLAPLAFTEELLIRGYPLMLLREALRPEAAVGITSVVFGLLHIGNPGSSVSAIAMAMLAGWMLGAIVVVSGSVFAATAAHVAWNWVMGGLLHLPVSGLGVATPDYRLVDSGPDWATGGRWGPEAGIGAAIGMACVVTYLHLRRARPPEA